MDGIARFLPFSANGRPRLKLEEEEKVSRCRAVAGAEAKEAPSSRKQLSNRSCSRLLTTNLIFEPLQAVKLLSSCEQENRTSKSKEGKKAEKGQLRTS